MKVPFHVVQARRERLALLIEQHRYLPVRELCEKLGVSEATARRDLVALGQEGKITRTYGGALPEFNDRFPSFRERQRQASRSKAKIGATALSFIEARRTYFFDSGTTIFALAEAFRDRPVTPVTAVTSNLPVGEMLAAIPQAQVFQLAGQLLHLQSTLLGETARKSLEFWTFDMAFLSAEGMTTEGLWNSQPAIIEQQKAVLRRSARSMFCIDGRKLNRQTPHFLLPWEEVDLLLTDVRHEKLRGAGISLREDQYVFAAGRQPVRTISREDDGDGPEAPGEEGGNLPVHIL